MPTWNDNYTDAIFKESLKYANATYLADLRSLDPAKLMLANNQQLYHTQGFEAATYGPTVDSDHVPDLLGTLYREGRFGKNAELVDARNQAVGSFFTPPVAHIDDELVLGLQQVFAYLPEQKEALTYAVKDLHPAVYDGTQSYRNWWEGARLLFSEVGFTCSHYYAASANPEKTYGYEFDIYPGFHGQDIPYTFHDDRAVATGLDFTALTAVQNASAAYILQDWILSFVLGNTPSSSVPQFVNLPLYAENATIGTINIGLLPEGPLGFYSTVISDSVNNDRCRWWQNASFAFPSRGASSGGNGTSGNGTTGGYPCMHDL